MAKQNQLDQVVEEVFDKFEILVDESKKAYLAEKGSENCLEIDSPESRTKIEKYCYDEHNLLLQPKETKLIIDQVKARAKFESDVVTVHRRTAKDGESLIVDLGQKNDDRAVVTESGIQVKKVEGYYFLRNSSMKEMKKPEKGAVESDLRKLVSTSNANWLVLFVWMTFVLFVTRLCPGAYPLLMVNAPKGSGKTSLCRFLMELLDPQEAPVRVFPKNEQDLIIALQQSNILCFDNLRKITQSISDVMCQGAVGAHYTTRELFSTGNEYRAWIKNPMIINSLHADMTAEMDLISRTVLLELSPIDDSERRTDADLQAEFAVNKGRYFGVILDGISKAMAHLDSVELEKLTRMADFCRWGKAIELGMGWPEGSFMEAYKANQDKLQKAATTENLLVQTVVEFLAECRGNWKSTPSELLEALNGFSTAGGRNNPKIWPQTAAALSRRLEAQQDALSINDVEVILYRSKHRQVELRRIEEPTEKVVAQNKVVDIHTGEAAVTAEVEELIIEDDRVEEVADLLELELDASEEETIQRSTKIQRRRRRTQQEVEVRAAVDRTIGADEDREVTAQTEVALEEASVAIKSELQDEVAESTADNQGDSVAEPVSVEGAVDDGRLDEAEGLDKPRVTQNRRRRRRTQQIVETKSEATTIIEAGEAVNQTEVSQVEVTTVDEPVVQEEVVEAVTEDKNGAAVNSRGVVSQVDDGEFDEPELPAEGPVEPKPERRTKVKRRTPPKRKAVAENEKASQDEDDEPVVPAERKGTGLKRRLLRKRAEKKVVENQGESLAVEQDDSLGSIVQPEPQSEKLSDPDTKPQYRRKMNQFGGWDYVDKEGNVVGPVRRRSGAKRRPYPKKSA